MMFMPLRYDLLEVCVQPFHIRMMLVKETVSV